MRLSDYLAQLAEFPFLGTPRHDFVLLGSGEFTTSEAIDRAYYEKVLHAHQPHVAKVM